MVICNSELRVVVTEEARKRINEVAINGFQRLSVYFQLGGGDTGGPE
jgi:hypothetical protein